MPDYHVPLLAAACKAAVCGTPHKAMYALGVVAAAVTDTLTVDVKHLDGCVQTAADQPHLWHPVELRHPVAMLAV